MCDACRAKLAPARETPSLAELPDAALVPSEPPPVAQPVAMEPEVVITQNRAPITQPPVMVVAELPDVAPPPPTPAAVTEAPLSRPSPRTSIAVIGLTAVGILLLLLLAWHPWMR